MMGRLERDQEQLFYEYRLRTPTSARVAGAPDADHVKADVGGSAMAVAGAQAPRVDAPAAAPQGDLLGLAEKGARGPLPDVAGHVFGGEGLNSR